MLATVLADFFKYKVVRSIIILSCWPPGDQLKLWRQLSQHGVSATFSCDPFALGNVHTNIVQGVVLFHMNNTNLEKVKPEYFSNHFKWLLVAEELPASVHQIRYDAEVTFLRVNDGETGHARRVVVGFQINASKPIWLEDIHVHPSEGATIHPWAHWTQRNGIVLMHDRARVLRKKDLRGYPLRIAAPVGYYSDEWYNGSYADYIEDETLKELDGGIRCGVGGSELVIEALNATTDLIQTILWSTTIHNSSMLLKLWYGEADLSGGILRILGDRLAFVDYVMPIWPFNVGFTYLAERESSSNMFVEPFTAGVWLTCLAIGVVLAISQRVCSRSREEKDGSYYAVLATCLQQDASAVPNGISGRWTFIVLSICSMLVHAYYTSAIVSALMSSGRSGPDSLRTLADSRYAIGSEDYAYMRYLFFDVKTNWNDLEYLKKKKKTSCFYQELDRGVELIQDGSTAFHSEYNQIFPYFKTFTDDQICKLQHIDTIPLTMTWITTTAKGQWSNVFRSVSAWILEVGLGRRLQSRLLALRPPCRSALLAEQVNFGDVAPLLGLTVSGAILSFILLGFEIIFDRWKKGTSGWKIGSLSMPNSATSVVMGEN